MFIVPWQRTGIDLVIKSYYWHRTMSLSTTTVPCSRSATMLSPCMTDLSSIFLCSPRSSPSHSLLSHSLWCLLWYIDNICNICLFECRSLYVGNKNIVFFGLPFMCNDRIHDKMLISVNCGLYARKPEHTTKWQFISTVDSGWPCAMIPAHSKVCRVLSTWHMKKFEFLSCASIMTHGNVDPMFAVYFATLRSLPCASTI